MRKLFAFFSVFASGFVFAGGQSDSVASEVHETAWSTYGYIAMGAAILIVAAVILLRKQHRKFNE